MNTMNVNTVVQQIITHLVGESTCSITVSVVTAICVNTVVTAVMVVVGIGNRHVTIVVCKDAMEIAYAHTVGSMGAVANAKITGTNIVTTVIHTGMTVGAVIIDVLSNRSR
jgi:hypothetical protein